MNRISAWLRYARADLRIASGTVDGPDEEATRDLYCFHAQQAAEKALKALLVSREVEFEYIHDLDTFLALIEDAPDTVQLAAALTPYAVRARYPRHPHAAATEDDLAQAIHLARTVLEWVETQIP